MCPRATGAAKLLDCEQHGRGSGAELFVVEGDSAALAVGAVRDPRRQAVLPMQGKPLNALRAPAGRVAAHPFYAALIDAIGTGWGAACDSAALRYERLVLLTDPDADGIHCGALLLLFFHRWMPQLLEQGHVEIVRAPVGELRIEGAERPVYAFSDGDFQALAQRLRTAGTGRHTALRYRGLASLGPAALAEHCVDRRTRRGRLLGTEDARDAMAVFASLGDLPPQQPLL
jgi:DNA gyrase subunit B/topoisomerase-4 subunit B